MKKPHQQEVLGPWTTQHTHRQMWQLPGSVNHRARTPRSAGAQARLAPQIFEITTNSLGLSLSGYLQGWAQLGPREEWTRLHHWSFLKSPNRKVTKCITVLDTFNKWFKN